MLRLEVLDTKDRVLSVHQLDEGLSLVGKSPGATVQLTGQGIGALHLGIKVGKESVLMDLGGPTRIKVDGKEQIEHKLSGEKPAVVEIGSRKLRVASIHSHWPALRTQKWEPLVDEARKGARVIRCRLYFKNSPEAVVNANDKFVLTEKHGVPSPHVTIWAKGKETLAQIPREWVALGGRIQVGKDKIIKLEDWATETRLERDTIYRVFAGPYLLEILVSGQGVVIGGAKTDVLPKELRKPFAISLASVLAVFGLWMLLMAKPDAKVEEPYAVYARIQNIPVEKLPEEPKPAEAAPMAGGGSGSESNETTAPTKGNAASQPSALAQSLTGGLKNLVGNVLSQSKANTAVVAESGVGQAVAAGAPGPAVGKLAAVGAGTDAVAGATRLGKLAIAGSGKGFSGGSGVGLGSGHGSGIGAGVGKGIGGSGFRLVEEESIVDGGLDKSVIAAVIQNNLSQIKYCYERQLVAEPDLFGKVVATWVINAQGTVENAAVKQTTLNSNPVEQCMLGKISGWKFPQPKNGTKVTVSYPFLFKSTK